MGTVHILLSIIMRLASVLIFLSFSALSSALFGPVPYLSQIAAAKAGLLATKSLLLAHLFRRKSKDNCEDEMETIVEVICNPTSTQECQNEPQEECQDTLIEVCKVVDEELCEEVEENVCEQVSKQECGESVKVCRTEQKCHTIIEKKCDTDQEDAKNNQEDIKLFCDKEWFKCLHQCKEEPDKCSPLERGQCKECGFETVEKCWDEEKEVCEPQKKVCENVEVPCKTVFETQCTTKSVPSCKTVTKDICNEEPEKVCNIVDREVCYEKTTEECEEVEKRLPTGKQC